MPADARLAALQRDFAAFLLRGDPAVAAALRPDVPAGRLAVYRNTVMGSLAAILGHAHPSLRRALGEERFTALACRFVAEAPPRRPTLWSYGAGFADWLAEPERACGHPPLPLAPWAPDLARLDWAMHEALFAADAEPLDLARLAAIPPEQTGALRLVPHPSLRLVRADWNIHALWKDGGAIPAAIPEAVLVGRSPESGTDEGAGGPAAEVRCARLTAADGALAARLLAGTTLDDAVADDATAGSDLQSLLALLLQNRLLAGFALDRPSSAPRPGGTTP
ncbi:DNA-binding domain-containing protein [Azospirillum sp. TSO35-2]|uniref:HvfC/BufC N-terminal domain-containing protein n=1 Tax=Azospirillum sp. TSO35-2 TaxID=716796 RepID=UPI000D647169|nr:DNA-binding domain-containing protein [Azospirillum sp. TSO35-2]